MDQTNNTPSGDQNNTTAPVSEPTVKAPKPPKERKKGPPASRVFDKAILAAAIAEHGGDVEKARLKLFDKGELNIGASVESVLGYVNGYREQAPHEGSGGYSSFATKHDAFTNQDMLSSFTVQGVARMMALLTARAAEFLMDAENAAAMSDALKGLDAYRAIALDEAKKSAEDKALNDAIATVAKARGCSLDDARAMLANFAVKPTAPAVAVAVETTTGPTTDLPVAEDVGEETLSEAGAPLADNADDNAPEGDNTADAPEGDTALVTVGGDNADAAPAADDAQQNHGHGKKGKKNRHR